MKRTQNHQTRKALFAIMCATCVFTMLIAGLWPFHAPVNNVRWLAQEDGLQFGHHGSIVSTAAFQPNVSNHADVGALELWLVAAPVEDRHTILAFEGPGFGESPFRIQQLGDALIVQRHNVDEHGTDRIGELHVEHALPADKRVFVTITLAADETSVYLNGNYAKSAPIMEASTDNFTGRVVLGNSPSASDSWPGQVFGLAIYRSELSASTIAAHYDYWRQSQTAGLTSNGAVSAIYLFHERAGQVIRNQVDRTTDLTIPARYFVLHPEFLSPPWRHFHNTWSYWGDVVVNVVGFVPFGFSFAGYLSALRNRSEVALTVAVGFALSLVIEVSQAFLPTRDSGVNDLITNPLGTAMGVALYHSQWLEPLVQRALSMVAPLPTEKTHEGALV